MEPKRLLSALIFTFMIFYASGQSSLELTFTAIDNSAYLQLDSIRVINRTQGVDTVLLWPDTILSICLVGVPEIPNKPDFLKVFKNYPNPVTDQTTISLYNPEKEKVSFEVTDITGRIIIKIDRVLDRGMHLFKFTTGSEKLYIFTASTKSNSSSIKILKMGSSPGEMVTLEYLASETAILQLKTTKTNLGFTFNPGDKLLCIGYANSLQSGIPDTPGESKSFSFQFATNIPCPGMPTVEYGEQIYSTIQIFSQCWLKENLNIGTMINGNINQTHNNILEKYCYDNDPSHCKVYGGLYQWGEMIQYTTNQNRQGICPPGWHVPDDEEWKVLEGSADNMYGIGEPEWDDLFQRGFDAATNLKSVSGWNAGGNGDDLFDFSALPGGFRNLNGWFGSFEGVGYWWTSTAFDGLFAWNRYINSGNQGIFRLTYQKDYSYSVRCLRDN